MKKWILFAILILVLCACNKKKHVEPNGYVWYEIKSDGLVGAEDAQGNKLLPCEYEAISLDTFITSHPSRTFMPSTEYFWRWDAAEAFCKNINLCITTKQINSIDTVRYSTVTYLDDTLMTPWSANDNKLEKVYRIVVKDENFKTIYECYKSHFSSAAYCLYNEDDWVFRHAPELNRKLLFAGCDFYPKYCRYLFNGKGQMIIPPERNYTGYAAYHIENGCFFIASTGKRRYQDPYAILSSNGEELFRVDCRTLYCPTWHVEHNDRGIFTFENYIGIDINEDGSIEMVYDDNKGFGVFQKPIENPYKLGNWGRVGEDELYWDWERKYGEKETEMIQNPKILWTGIKIPEYSSTFDVEPSNSNKKGELIDLYKIATQKGTSKKAKEGLLHEGIYTCDGQAYGVGINNSFYNQNAAWEGPLEIYEDYVSWSPIFTDIFYKKTLSDGTRVYKTQEGMNEDFIHTVYVSPSYKVSYTLRIETTYGASTYKYYLTEVSASRPNEIISSGVTYGQSNNQGTAWQGTHTTIIDEPKPQKHCHNVTRQEDCPSCHRTGRCSTCNGKGWYYDTFGNGKLPCPNCTNGTCRKCNGTGYITKTEMVYD